MSTLQIVVGIFLLFHYKLMILAAIVIFGVFIKLYDRLQAWLIGLCPVTTLLGVLSHTWLCLA